MKQFNLNEYLKNPNRKIVTRIGLPVRIICVDRLDCDFPIVTLINNGDRESIVTYGKDGKLITTKESKYDLFFVPEKKEGWIHLCKSDNKYPYVRSSVFETKEEAEKYRRTNDGSMATIIKIEWEE